MDGTLTLEKRRADSRLLAPVFGESHGAIFVRLTETDAARVARFAAETFAATERCGLWCDDVEVCCTTVTL